MFRWVVVQIGWILVGEILFYGMIYSLALGIIVSTLDKFGERR